MSLLFAISRVHMKWVPNKNIARGLAYNNVRRGFAPQVLCSFPLTLFTVGYMCVGCVCFSGGLAPSGTPR